mmetsp:Transcript_23420/g.53363  ORF Transcript_23420/g.53363 Transcript_23420/m.53363 type:complete len:208 (+) Transcript_23420:1258-1881(+)
MPVGAVRPPPLPPSLLLPPPPPPINSGAGVASSRTCGGAVGAAPGVGNASFKPPPNRFDAVLPAFDHLHWISSYLDASSITSSITSWLSPMRAGQEQMTTRLYLPFLVTQSTTSSSKSLMSMRLFFGRTVSAPSTHERSISSISASHSYLVRLPHCTSPAMPTSRISPPSFLKRALLAISAIESVVDCSSRGYQSSDLTSRKSGSCL